MCDHTLTTVRQELYVAERQVHDLETELWYAQEYLRALHERHAELVLSDADEDHDR
jgi:hypothetical protein